MNRAIAHSKNILKANNNPVRTHRTNKPFFETPNIFCSALFVLIEIIWKKTLISSNQYGTNQRSADFLNLGLNRD